MKKFTLLQGAAVIASLALVLSSCQAIGDIFKTGVGVGIFIVVIVVVIIIWIISKVGGSKS